MKFAILWLSSYIGARGAGGNLIKARKNGKKTV
jgi:hypothetical protein